MSNIHRFPERGRAPPPGRAVVVSPRFIPIAAAFLASGFALYSGIASGGVSIFVFVMSGWIVSLCLHEFGHAYVAYLGGDVGVKERGYLSLDPLGYTQPMFSIVLPVLFLAMGASACRARPSISTDRSSEAAPGRVWCRSPGRR
ncbi:MAG: hypothetical protein HZY79_10385 [Rhodoblastus sp.]|nr:MAG: hypothetical protein HZY79_10385 [Rhodoblastus sp.]